MRQARAFIQFSGHTPLIFTIPIPAPIRAQIVPVLAGRRLAGGFS